MQVIRATVLVILGLGISCASADGQVVATWTGSSGNWSDSSNWSTCPPAACPVVPNNGGGISYNVTLDGSQAAAFGTVTFDASGTVVNNLTLFSEVLQDNGLSPTLTVLGEINSTGGTINWGTGVLNVGDSFSQQRLGGTTTIGGAAILNVGGSYESGTFNNFTVATGGLVNVEQAFNVGENSFATIAGTMNVGGTYNNNFLGGETIVSGLLDVGGDLVNSPDKLGFFEVNGGTVHVDGNVLNQGGSGFGISLGGIVSVNGNYSNGSSSMTDVSGVLLTKSFQQTDGSTTIESGGLLSANTFQVSGGTVTVDGILDPTAVEIDSGASLQGTGLIIGNVAMGGTIVPGDSGAPGTLMIVGNYEQIGDGILEELIGPTSHSSLDVSGDVALDSGSYLSITLLDGYDPLGQTFDFMNYSSLLGQFSNGSTFWSDGYLWDISYGQNQIDATAVSAVEPSSLYLLLIGLAALAARAYQKTVKLAVCSGFSD